MNLVFVVNYQNASKIETLVVIQDIPEIKTRTGSVGVNQILDWYAEKYAMERSKLSGYFVDSIEYKD